MLRDGDALVLESVPLIVTVHASPEPVFVLSPQTTDEWALWSYHMGNAHQPLMIDSDRLVLPDVAGVEQMLTYHAIPYVRDVRPFTPVSQAMSDHARS
jgi:urease accessory protein UreE